MQPISDFRQLSARTLTTAAAALALAVVANATAEAHGHRNDNKFPVYLDRPLDTTATNNFCVPAFSTDPLDNMWAGTGLNARHFVRKRNVEDGVELAIRGKKPYVGDIYPATYVDGDGLVHIEVPTGTFFASPPTGSERANWSFDYSINVALKSGNPSLDKYKVELWVDTDASDKTDFYTS